MSPRRGNGRPPVRRRPLTRREVVSAALELVDAEGVDALTMRKLADRIGVYPTAVYWHAGNKASLLAAVAELVLSGIQLPPVEGGPPWEDWLRSMARSARASLHAHPNIAPVLASQLQVTTSSFPLAESVLAVLHKAGFAGERLTDAYNTVIGFVFGWIFGELTAEPAEAAEDWTRGFERQLRDVDPQTAPTLASNLPALANRAFMLRWESGRRRPMDSSFELALDVLVAGLAAQPRTAAGSANREMREALPPDQ